MGDWRRVWWSEWCSAGLMCLKTGTGGLGWVNGWTICLSTCRQTIYYVTWPRPFSFCVGNVMDYLCMKWYLVLVLEMMDGAMGHVGEQREWATCVHRRMCARVRVSWLDLAWLWGVLNISLGCWGFSWVRVMIWVFFLFFIFCCLCSLPPVFYSIRNANVWEKCASLVLVCVYVCAFFAPSMYLV